MLITSIVFKFLLVKHKSCCLCDFGRFIVSIGSPCLERFGKSEKFFKKICYCPVCPTQKQKKQRVCLCLVLWLCLPKTTSIIPQDAPFELNLMFCTQSRFTYYFVLYWVRERYEHSRYILLKEGHPIWATLIFIKEKSELQRFVSDCRML